MDFVFRVGVSVERREGKFASRDEIMEQLRAALESADPSSVEGEGGGTYETTSWDVEDATPIKRTATSKGGES